MCKFSIAAAMLAVSISAAGTTAAQTREGADSTQKILPDTDNSKAAEALLLGYRLADYARATKDARAMIVAAKIVDAAPVKEGTDKGSLDRETKAGVTPESVTGTDLFAEAARLAAGDADLMAEIEAARAEASKGTCSCMAYRMVQYIPGNATWTVRFTVRGGEPKVFGMRRDSATPLGLKIFDEFGNLVCQDMSGNVALYCRVNPIWTGPYTVQAINYGEQGTGVALVTS